MNISFAAATTPSLAPLSYDRATALQSEARPAPVENASPAEKGDQVNLRPQARLLEDSEVDAVLAESMGMIASDPYSALHAHSGLDAARVAALLS